MNKVTQIKDFVDVAPRFLRSVNLASDWHRSESFAGYIITPNVLESLERIRDGLQQSNGQRAFTLIGPYGSGKSAFAVYLCQLLAKGAATAASAHKQLADKDQNLAAKFDQISGEEKANGGFLPIAITARRRPIAQLILEGLSQSLEGLKKTQPVLNLITRIQEAKERDFWQDTATILTFLEEIASVAKVQGYSGILLLIDEAGKTLEYALQDREGGDVYVFQEIAENANRQSSIPLLFLITLHQMFDDYVELAERTIRAEWTKVQERFHAIQFAETAATTMQLVADALHHPRPLPKKVAQAIDDVLSDLEKCSVPLPIGMNMNSFRQLAQRSWPLHPTVLLAIPHLFRRLAQNERSIFSYLTSHEPYGFQEHIRKSVDKDVGFVRLHDLYTYLLANFEAGLARLPHAKRLLEANDVINSRRGLSELSVELIRTIAMLNVLGEICPLRARAKFLACAFRVNDIEAELSSLKQQSIITFRQLDGSYRVWEGSDVDIEARMKEARRHLHLEGHSLLATLRRHLPPRTLIARRHNLLTGAYRFFNITYTEKLEKPDKYASLKFSDEACGKVVVVIPNADWAALRKGAEQATRVQPKLIVALPKQIETLRSMVEEVACLRWVAEHTEELRDDRVARRELSLRLVESEQRISQLLQTLIDPRPAPYGNSCRWFWQGQDQKVKSLAEVTRLVSTACDTIFPQSPCLRNELIARRSISSAAAAARRNLLEKMLIQHDQERLGINGFPPERSMYESVLRASGLHTLDSATGRWQFQPPPKDNNVNLRPCWDLLESKIFTSEVNQVSLKEIFNEMAKEPIGLAGGVHPVIFTSFYLCHQDVLFLYREGSFLPDPQIAHFELLQRRPDLFTVSGARLDGIRYRVIKRLAKGLGTSANTASVIRALFRVLNALPSVTKKTSRLYPEFVVEMRDKFMNARSPEKLLFSELPECFGLKPFLANEQRDEDIENFFAKLNAALQTLVGYAAALRDTMRNNLLRKCQLPENDEGWEELCRRAAWLSPRINHEILTPFCNSVLNGVTDNHNPAPALSYIVGRAFEQWTDHDVDRFPGLADGIADLFRQYWGNFGNSGPELTVAEVRQKDKLRALFKQQLPKLAGRTTSYRVMRAAMQEALQELENATQTNENGRRS
ncbi:hypothetical protein [Desulfonatronospira sp.]|uniref:hypothetical protein n=1 Tax=Desulfonatronospira sp. TaxID=1962951 RepID=UPI0025C60785|nr:hypothetical protein [Desulfonatronospira sp.]